ncbi:hypothetical protein [Marinospirillum perlucidum]|uniref:hypothetical protein n=1 Tax=Marinospirillum perlucidum TaxID=1982602 RepID=UPI00138FBDEF|nr:hypothetical protein [Marinospirillum perlucidum]
MPKTAIGVSLRVSNWGRLTTLALVGLGLFALVSHPDAWLAIAGLPLILVAAWRWYLDFGPAAPAYLLFEDSECRVLDRSGRELARQPRVLWWSYLWLALELPGRPPGFKAWLIWPDMVSAEERRQLRRLLKRS